MSASNLAEVVGALPSGAIDSCRGKWENQFSNWQTRLGDKFLWHFDASY